MATVKRKPSGKIVLKNGKVSCGCCGCCNLLNYESFKLLEPPENCIFHGVGWAEYEQPEIESPEIGYGWRRDGVRRKGGSCFRGVCISASNGEVINSEVYGGPTTNNLDLIDLVMSNFESRIQTGCYVARIEFYGWIKKIAGKRKWRASSDTKWFMVLYKMECGGGV
jgi:hypothetical protein